MIIGDIEITTNGSFVVKIVQWIADLFKEELLGTIQKLISAAIKD